MNKQLVDSFKKDHVIIRNFLEQLLLKDDIIEVRNELEKISEVISIHLKKEDDLLYPNFLESKEEEIRKLGEIFSDVMKTYSSKFEKFVKEVSESSEYGENLKNDCKYICERISSRITIEETILYPAFSEYFGK